MTLPRQVACTPITPTPTRAQRTSHTEVVYVVGCGVEEIGEESGTTSSKPKIANSCVARNVVHHLTTHQKMRVGCVNVRCLVEVLCHIRDDTNNPFIDTEKGGGGK